MSERIHPYRGRLERESVSLGRGGAFMIFPIQCPCCAREVEVEITKDDAKDIVRRFTSYPCSGIDAILEDNIKKLGGRQYPNPKEID